MYPWKTVRIGHSCAAVSSYDSPPVADQEDKASRPKKLVKAGEKGALLRASPNLESEYLATGFSLRALERSRESFIAKMKGETE